jgi:alpha-tubulin suppressor-like RCC1 family protein
VTVAGYLGTTASGTAQGSVGLSFIPDELSGTVTFDLEVGAASAVISGDTVQSTDAEGKASVQVFPNFPGSVTVRAFLGAGTAGEAIGKVPLRWVPGPPVELYFVDQPSLTVPGAQFLINPVVVAMDSDGWFVDDPDIEIQIEIEGGTTLQGTTTRPLVDGSAEFSGLSVDVPRAGMRFIASSPGLASARSGRFTSMHRESFSLGGATTCMPDVSGVVYCWGANTTGQGGLSAADSLFAPVAIGGSPEGYRSVKTATTHTCALTRTTSQAWCWGTPEYPGHDGIASSEPRGAPLPVTGGGSYDWLSIGGTGSCGRLGAGFFEDATVCWGANTYGQLGNGDIRDRLREISVVQLAGDPFTSIAKSAHTSCGVTEGHDLYCWGRRAYGAVGDGILDANQIQLTPIEVGIGKQWQHVSGMGNTFCATTTSGEIYCWGGNAQGGSDVGDGFCRIDFAPRLLSNFGVGYGYACLVDEQGTPYCWGAFRRAGRQGHSQSGYALVGGNLRIVTEPS